MPKNLRQKNEAQDLLTMQELSLNKHLPATQQTQRQNIYALQDPAEQDDQFYQASDFLSQADMTDLHVYSQLHRKNKISRDGAFGYRIITVHPPLRGEVKTEFWSVSSDALKVSTNIYGKRVEHLDSSANLMAHDLAGSLGLDKTLQERKKEGQARLQKEINTYGTESLSNHLAQPQKLTQITTENMLMIDQLHQKSVRADITGVHLLLLTLSLDSNLNLQISNRNAGFSYRVPANINFGHYDLSGTGDTVVKEIGELRVREFGVDGQHEEERWVGMGLQEVVDNLPNIDLQAARKQSIQYLQQIQNISPIKSQQYPPEDFSLQRLQLQTQFQGRYQQLRKDYAGVNLEQLIGTGSNEFFQLVDLKIKKKNGRRVRFKDDQRREMKGDRYALQVDFSKDQKLDIEDLKVKRKKSKKNEYSDCSVQHTQLECRYRYSDQQLFDRLTHQYIAPKTSSQHQKHRLQPQHAQLQMQVGQVLEVEQAAQALELAVLSDQLPSSMGSRKSDGFMGQPAVNMKSLKESLLRQIRVDKEAMLDRIGGGDGASIQLRFISLLHLANQNHFHLEGVPDGSNIRVLL